MHGDTKHYQFDFYPKNERNITFRGQFTVEDSSFALTGIHATLPNDANLNFVRDFKIYVTYQKTPDGNWFYAQQKVHLNMALSKKEGKAKKKNRYTIRKSVDFADLGWNGVVGEQLSALSVDDLQHDEDIKVARASFETESSDSFRQEAYAGIEVLKQNTVVKLADKFGAMGITGYFNAGPVDIGPIYDLYRRNRIEGHRVTLPLRTSENLSKYFSLNGYLGYGFRSKAIKYGAGMNILLPTRNRSTLSLRYSDDYTSLSRNKYIEFVRENAYSNGDGNVISSFSETPNPYILGRKHFSLTLRAQTKKDIGFLVRPFRNQFIATEFVPFKHPAGDASYAQFENRGVLFDTRLSFGQDYDDMFFNRFYYGNNKPVIHLTTEVGQNTISNRTYNYAHFQTSVKSKVNLGPAYLRFLVDAGYIMGKVPFPMLHLPRGSQSLGLARYNYSLMKQAALASDLYSNAYLSLNGGGLLFNKLPLIKKLNLRESFSFKAFYGRFTGKHDELLALPQGIYKAPNTPYMELGAGVANIFKVLRVEYVRRLSNGPLMDQISSKDGIRLRLEVSF